MSAIAPPPPRSESLLDATAAAPVREAQEPVGEERDRADQDADEQREADVEVADVAHLVADDALELLPVELLEQAGRDGHAGVLRITSRGERVGRRVVDDPYPWRRQTAGEPHLLDDIEQLPVRLGGLRAIDLPGAARCHDERVARVVRADAHHGRDDQRQRDAAPAEAGRIADRTAHDPEQEDDRGDEQPAPPSVAGDLAIERRRRRPRLGGHRRLRAAIGVPTSAGSPRARPHRIRRSGSSRARGSRTCRR